MKKSVLALLFIIPLFAFSQEQTLPRKEKKAIESYLNSFCICVNEVISSLNPIMIEYIEILSESGEENAQIFLNDYVANATPEEISEFLASTTLMQSESFTTKLDNCDNKDNSGMSQKSIHEIDNDKGASFDYLIESLSKDIDCKLTEMFLEIADKE